MESSSPIIPLVDPERSNFAARWEATRRLWRQSNVRRDPFLEPGAVDLRRGLSLIARPGTAFAEALSSDVKAMESLTGPQYVYPPVGLHLTVATFNSASEAQAPSPADIAACREALVPWLESQPAFTLELRGLSASPEAVLVKAFDPGGAMKALRERIRGRIQGIGLGAALDKRYLRETSHVTVLRFVNPLPDVEPLIAYLDRRADTSFGSILIDGVELVRNDWYHTAEKTERIAQCAFKSSR